MSSSPFEATCTAPVNIAVVKYWGKRDTALILPTNSSLSVTLDQDDLRSLTTARVIETGTHDRLWLNGIEEQITPGSRIETCLKELRHIRNEFESKDTNLDKIAHHPLHIASENNFPTAAGLASSASGLSALIKTIATVYNLEHLGYSVENLSRIARQGSGSACRSMFGGYVGWQMGERADGHDSVAYQVVDKEHWSTLDAIILVVSDKKKGTASTAGMQRTVHTSALLEHRIKHVVPQRMQRIEHAIRERDFDTFARQTIADSNQFHAVCLDTTPPIFYLNDTSRQIIQLVEELNRASVEAGLGLVAAYTYDAGPNAVLYVERKHTQLVLQTVLEYFPQREPIQVESAVETPKTFNRQVIQRQEVGAVTRIIQTRVGDGPRVLDTNQHGLFGPDGFPKNQK
ncbi:diphosphomevalonate decarboxylase MVD1 [Sporobolomyces koalae]|uniref:diphosphomevalonate decarboxylase MVD1 n=1 Tax=Sporobolomyces koalae TaxID=500713 RepID=UPI003179D862